jgi:hypothetical protein
VFFEEQTLSSMMNAILRFEAVEDRFSPQFIRGHIDQFDKRHFIDKMGRFVAAKLDEQRALTELPARSVSVTMDHAGL